MATVNVTVPADSVLLIATAMDTVYVSTQDDLPMAISFAGSLPTVDVAAHPFSKGSPFSASGVGTLNTYLINKFNRAIT